jgi:predicted negative regulator of RcsB-dependent stress response
VQKFLVIQTAFIGDVVLATGLIEKLHAQFPDARIDFLVRKGNEALLEAHPYLHEVLVWDKKQNKLRNLWKMACRIRRTRYDKVINVQRFAATGLLTAFSGAHETIGFDKNPLSRFFTKPISHIVSYEMGTPYDPSSLQKQDTRHEVDRNQELIRDFTDTLPARPRLYPSAKDKDKVARIASDMEDKYGRTAYAQMSALLAARALGEAGDAAGEKAQLQWAIAHAQDDEYKQLAKLRLAGVLLDQKSYDEGLKMLGDTPPAAFEGLFADRRGDLLVAQDKIADARTAYKLALDKLDKQDAAMRQFVQFKLDALGS